MPELVMVFDGEPGIAKLLGRMLADVAECEIVVFSYHRRRVQVHVLTEEARAAETLIHLVLGLIGPLHN